MAKLRATLPKGDGNGLPAIERLLLDEPHRVQVVIALVDCQKIVTDTDTGENEATVRIRRIEGITEGDRDLAGKIMRRALERRTGATVLPFDLEEDLRNAFDAAADDQDDDGG